jgi:hypothetical protein
VKVGSTPITEKLPELTGSSYRKKLEDPPEFQIIWCPTSGREFEAPILKPAFELNYRPPI